VRRIDDISANGRKVFHERKAAMIARAAKSEDIALRDPLGHDRIGSADFDNVSPVEFARSQIDANRN
jgi:hypothetical protein